MDDSLVCVGPVSSFESSHRHVLSWRSHRDPSLHDSILLFRFPSPPGDDAPPSWKAMESECPHLAAPLEHAVIEDMEDYQVLVCPWHNYDFRLDTGESSTGMKACTFRVEVRGDLLYVQPPGLAGDDWRLLSLRPVSERFASSTGPPLPTPTYDLSAPPKTVAAFCRLILLTSAPLEKVALTRRLVASFRAGELTRISSPSDLPPPDEPPREPTATVVSLFATPKRGRGGTIESRAKLLHALAWIELWAIDLALDICVRFAGWKVGSLDGKTGTKLPLSFFSDFLKVAEDEAKHFSLLKNRIEEMGYAFGDFPVHNGLWDSATETAGSLFSRLAIIHLVHEARGLDVNPKQIQRCRHAGDKESADVMTIIHNDEVTHVAAGHRHFQFLCKQADPPLDPVKQFRHEVTTHFHGKLKGPFNEEDRAKAGLTGEWYAGLSGVVWDSAARPEGSGPPKVGLDKGMEALKV